MREIKAPSRPGLERRIFLAGSIEMGQAEQWQKRIVDALSGAGDLVILNPRRDDWDDSWPQRADDPQFSEQVSWELDMTPTLHDQAGASAPGLAVPAEPARYNRHLALLRTTGPGGPASRRAGFG